MKHFSCILLILILVLSFTSVLADGAPTSQFGFHGWPYRQTTSCSAGCRLCSGNQDCSSCPQCQGCIATAISKPTATPVPKATPQATMAPTAPVTPKPTKAPTAVPRPTARPTTTSSGDYTTTSVAVQEQKMLDLLNRERLQNGLSALKLDGELSRIARIKSQDMNQNGYFAHESPTYGNAASMLKKFGYPYSGVGENIAHHANVEKAHAAFMSSTGHRANILGSQWTKVGIGISYDKNGFVYITEIFVR